METVSVVIPTYRDWGRLSLCLNALQSQKYDTKLIQVVVVNNDPLDKPPTNFVLPSNTILLTESKPGSYAARNRALLVCTGDIIGFTDSDCIPDVNWISNAVQYFRRDESLARLAGAVELFYKGQKCSTAELYESVYAFNQMKNVKEGVSVTANLFVLKKVLEVVGVFDERLKSGGDFEWNRRASDANLRIIYASDVIVKHPARYFIHELVKKDKRIAGWIGSRRGMAIKRFVKYLLPPVTTFVACRKKKLNFSESIRVFVLRYRLNFIRSVEEINVSFGKTANRE